MSGTLTARLAVKEPDFLFPPNVKRIFQEVFGQNIDMTFSAGDVSWLRGVKDTLKAFGHAPQAELISEFITALEKGKRYRVKIEY